MNRHTTLRAPSIFTLTGIGQAVLLTGLPPSLVGMYPAAVNAAQVSGDPAAGRETGPDIHITHCQEIQGRCGQ